MDTIDKWLKSLRLHKYTHLFKTLTYEQMLNLEEKYLIDLDITKGARNKILVSVKKLNLRQERLIHMIDDLNQENISMKEALTVLKDMLITPIPPPSESNSSSSSSSSSTTSSSLSSSASSETSNDSISLIDLQSPQLQPKMANYSHPNDLTYLFVETFEKVVQRLIESAGMEDSACHGIMAAIVDECLKHDSFTRAQKAKVASYKQHTLREQRAKMAGFKQQQHHHHQQPSQQHFTKEIQQQQQQQRAKMASFKQNQQYHHLLRQYPQQQQQRVAHGYNQHDNFNSHNLPLYQQQLSQIHYNLQSPKSHQFHTNQKNHPPSLSISLSTTGSTSNSDEESGHQQTTYPEYSLLGPGMTFELPCLRARHVERGLNSSERVIGGHNIQDAISWLNVMN